jgi:branched-chain amino acid transport system substrate-binding protein
MIRTSLIAASLALFGLACEKKPVAPAAPVKVKAVEATPVTPPPAEPAGILLGEVGSLTGSEAAFGISTRNGIELALEEVNAAGGVKGQTVAVRVLRRSERSPRRRRQPTTRLITQDKVVAISGRGGVVELPGHGAHRRRRPRCPWSRRQLHQPQGHRGGRLHLSRVLHRPVPGRGDGQATPTTRLQVLQARRHSHRQEERVLRGADRGVPKAKFAEIPRATIVRASRPTPRATPIFARSSPTSRSSRPDALYVPGYYQDVAIIAEQARELGLKVPMMGGDGWDSGEAVRAGRHRPSRAATCPTTTRPTTRQPRVQDFIKKYQAKFGAVPDSLAALGYDAARVVLDALKRAPDASGPFPAGRHRPDQGLPRRGRHHHPRRQPQPGQARGGAEGRGRQVQVRRYRLPLRESPAFSAFDRVRARSAPH